LAPTTVNGFAQSVKRLSDHYVSQPEAISPWSEPWARDALLAYYHSLNFSRTLAACGRSPGFFDGIEHLVDLGCGSGAASLGIRAFHPVQTVLLSDPDTSVVAVAARQHQSYSDWASSQGWNEPPTAVKVGMANLDSTLHAIPASIAPSTLVVLSYVLTEIKSDRVVLDLFNQIAKSGAEGLLILEPSTSEDARRLHSFRSQLNQLGFSIWGPCNHSGECPLLLHSDRDWCHDRTAPLVPSWFQKLEQVLPIKNQTVTFSYLMLRRSPKLDGKSTARVVGDTLEEKGKSRQLICRGPDREFLSWFPSRLKVSVRPIHRGDQIALLPDDIDTKKGSESSIELRMKESFWKDLSSND